MSKPGCNGDCFQCEFDDCINDSVYSEKSLYKNRSEQAKANQRLLAKKARDAARERGDCIICRKRPSKYGSKCLDCYVRQRRYDTKKNTGERDRRRREGLCYFCGEIPSIGYKLCQKHLEIARKALHGKEPTIT